MKNKQTNAKRRSLIAIALVTIIGFTFAACGDGSGDGGGTGGGGGSTREAKTYTGVANDVTYTLKIEDGGSRAVLTPAQGDKYTLTQNANTKKSTGTVTKVVGGVLTLAPKGDPDDEFTATVSGDNITAMSGTITWDDGTANEAPDTLTPSGGDNPGPGTDPGIDNNWKWTAVSISTFGTSLSGAIAYGNNRFVVVGDDGKIAYSSDGASWTAVSDSKIWEYTDGLSMYIADIRGIAYGNNRFVAVGYAGKMAYSDDGVSWTAVSNSTAWEYINDNGRTSITGIHGIAYGNNRFVAWGDFGRMAYSDDGASWTAVEEGAFGPAGSTLGDLISIASIAYGNNRFVAVGNSGKMAYSSDGASWTTVANSTIWDYKSILSGQSETVRIRAVAYGNNRFVAGGDNCKIAYSDDGINWTAVSSINDAFTLTYKELYYINAIAYGNNRFVAGGSSDKIAYSADGASWTAVSVSDYLWMNGIAYGNNRFVALGSGGNIAYADW